MSITIHGLVNVPLELAAAAHEIKHQNYKVNTPKRFHKNAMHEDSCEAMRRDIAALLGAELEKVDFVYFACSQGAKEHVDELDPALFSNKTIIVPLVLPKGKSLFRAQNAKIALSLNTAYEFNHEKPHELTLEDTQSGCVVLMASLKH